MEAATNWALIFHQDPAIFDAGNELDMAKRIASLNIADRLLEEARAAHE